MNDSISLEPGETVPVTITLYMPKKVTLPATRDVANGEVWPSAGIAMSRVFNAPDLIQAGIEVEWKTDDGTVIPPDVAMALIEKHTQMIKEGHAIPNFAPVADELAGVEQK